MSNKYSMALLVGLLCLAVVGAALAASSTYSVERHVIGGGGGDMSSANYSARGTLGQAVTGSSSSENYQGGTGYWPGEEEEAGKQYPIFLPVVLKNYS